MSNVVCSQNFLYILDGKDWVGEAILSVVKSHLPPISKTIQIRRTRHAGHKKIKGRTHKRCTPVDFFTQKSKGWAPLMHGFWECREPLYCHRSQVVASERVVSMGQIELNCELMLN